MKEFLFTTKSTLPREEFKISHKERIMLIGSCFADNIGNRLQERRFNICSNPFGVQYNPLSIAQVLKRVATGELFNEHSPEIFKHNDKWHSIMHHSDFSRNSRAELLECINASLSQAHRSASECDLVIVTFGTAYVYTRISDGRIASNCHKLPGREFSRTLLSIREIADELSEIIKSYKAINSKIKFLFTVSPIRHLRDGAHDNQKSKSTLLLAVDEIINRHSNCHYFPAYEIMLDELRDYRFYAEDMVHPSKVAVEYIWECFSECYFREETKNINKRIEDIIKGLEHRPFDEKSDGYRKFIGSLIGKIESITAEYPEIDFKKLLTQCNTLLNR